jgi:hypothetical protein
MPQLSPGLDMKGVISIKSKRFIGLIVLIVGVGFTSACDPLSELSNHDLAFRIGDDGGLSVAVCREMTVGYAQAQVSPGEFGPANTFWEATGDAVLSSGSILMFDQATPDLKTVLNTSPDISNGDYISVYIVDKVNQTSSVALFEIADKSSMVGLWMDSEGNLSELPCSLPANIDK